MVTKKIFLIQLGNLFLIGSVISFLSFASLYWQRNDPHRLDFDASDFDHNVDYKDAPPVAISIDDLSITLPIITAKKVGNNWETTEKGVSYLESSPIPGQNGNSVLYGHNWGSLLGGLPKAHAGGKIHIIYSNGTNKEFTIEETKTVPFDDTSILKNTHNSQITLYTCTGFLDLKRFVVVAKPV